MLDLKLMNGPNISFQEKISMNMTEKENVEELIKNKNIFIQSFQFQEKQNQIPREILRQLKKDAVTDVNIVILIVKQYQFQKYGNREKFPCIYITEDENVQELIKSSNIYIQIYQIQVNETKLPEKIYINSKKETVIDEVNITILMKHFNSSKAQYIFGVIFHRFII